MNGNTYEIARLAKVDIEQAKVIHQVIDQEWLVDWSEDSTAKVRRAIKEAQAFIAAGFTWEVA